MSKNHIKIFDDTVLKLSINQGTEDQRMATNIGRFSSGELAFTRDTGRIFVGNYSDKEYDSSIMLPETRGGILAGNKYLGYIDSKPLSWWKKGNIESTPLDYEKDTTYTPDDSVESPSKDNHTRESSMLGPDSKYRNKKAKDGNRYVSKWERDAVYNEKYDAYNGDYIYDMYQNAIILFDNNITNKTLSVTGVDGRREQFYDENGNILPIDEQYRRTKIEKYENGHPSVYGDGYVIFRNIEPDGVTLRFKEKIFNDDGTTNYEAGTHNYSHNVLEVVSVGADAVANVFDAKYFTTTGNISLKPDLTDINSILNNNNSFTLPQKLTLRPKVIEGGESNIITLDFRNSNKEMSSNVDETYTFNLIKSVAVDGSATYDVRVGKPATSEFYIKLGNGLKNTGFGDPSYLKLNSTTAGNLDFNTPTISLNSEENLFNVDNRELSNPFISIFSDNNTGIYSGNLHITNSGIIDKIEDYEEEYKNLNISKIQKFETDKNLSVNYLNNPISILWNQNGTGYSSNDTKIDVSANFLLKPHFFCSDKDVAINGKKDITDAEYDNSVYVLGNNHYKSKEEKGDYMVIPGYNYPVEKSLKNVADLDNVNRIFKSMPGVFPSSLKDVEKDGYILKVDETSGKEIYTIYDKSIFNESDDGPFFNDDTIYDNIITDYNGKNISLKELSEQSSSKYLNYKNIENGESLLDMIIHFDVESEDNNIIIVDECVEYNVRNKQVLKDGDDIVEISINMPTMGENPEVNFHQIFSAESVINSLGLSYDTDTKTFSSSKLNEENNYTILYGNVVITKNPEENFDSFIISIYPNGNDMVYEENMPTVMRVKVKNNFDIEEERDVDITNKIIPNKYLTLYKKISSQYVSATDKEKMAHYYTTSFNDSIDGLNPKFVAFVQLLKENGSVENISPDDFVDGCGSFCHVLNMEENGYEILKIESSIFNSGFNTTNTNFKDVNQVTFVIAEQKLLAIDANASYKDSNGVDIVTEDIQSLSYVEYTTESHIMSSIFWSAKGVHSPKDYTDTTVYIPSDSGTTTMGNIKCITKSNVTLKETISENDEKYVVIPSHASEAILEVTHVTNTSSPIVIFTASEDNLKKLSKTKIVKTTTTNDNGETIETDTLVPITPSWNFDIPNIENIYKEDEDSGEYVVMCPSFNEDEDTHNLMQAGVNEKCVLYSNDTSTHTIRVPLYYTGFDSTKGCSIRISGLKPSSSEKVLVRLIGYVA